MTAKFQIRADHRVGKTLAHLDPVIRVRISRAIKALGDDPEPPGCKALLSMDYVLRIRVGDYRVLYRIDRAASVVTIIDVGHRRDIYDK